MSLSTSIPIIGDCVVESIHIQYCVLDSRICYSSCKECCVHAMFILCRCCAKKVILLFLNAHPCLLCMYPLEVYACLKLKTAHIGNFENAEWCVSYDVVDSDII